MFKIEDRIKTLEKSIETDEESILKLKRSDDMERDWLKARIKYHKEQIQKLKKGEEWYGKK